MATDEPAFLVKGVEVSAKYKGAFCEAKVKIVEKCVKCKVTLKDDGKCILISDEDIIGTLKVGASVEVKLPGSGTLAEATINRIHDQSMYTVVFDDGDENRLKRTKLCPKGGRHFMKSETLDDAPLTHPEHFGTPVVKKLNKSKSPLAANCSDSDSDAEESAGGGDSDSARQARKQTYSCAAQDWIGRVAYVDVEEPRTKKVTTVPMLVVLPSADDVCMPTKHHLLARSFKDDKFVATTISELKTFTWETAAAAAALKKMDKVSKTAFDKARLYAEKNELPSDWSRSDLLGYSSDDDSESDDEQSEKRDCFVAQLYKFMDDRGTPINKVPTIADRDLDLSKLFRIVRSLGGYNRVTTQMRWHIVHSKLLLPSATSVYTQLKNIYKEYLHAFEDFNRKLGCTMESMSVRGDRGRHAPSRHIISFRERERDSTTKSMAASGKGRKPGSMPVKEEEGSAKTVADKISKASISQTVPGMHNASEKSDSPSKYPATKKEGKVADSLKLSSMVIKGAVRKESNEESDGQSSDTATKTSTVAMASAQQRMSQIMTAKFSLYTQSLPHHEIMQRRLGHVFQMESGNSVGKVKEKLGRQGTATRGKEEAEGGYRDDRLDHGKAVVRLDGDFAASPCDSSERGSGTERGDTERDEKKRKRHLRGGTMNLNDDNDDIIDDDNAGVVKQSDDDNSSRPSRRSSVEEVYAVGSRLKVRYGKGKNQKIYTAKVMEAEEKGGSMRYKVHYDGWNSRYDEWVRRDMIVCLDELPPSSAEAAKNKSTVAKSQITSVHRKKLQPRTTTVSSPSSTPLTTSHHSSLSGKEEGRSVKPKPVGPLSAVETVSQSGVAVQTAAAIIRNTRTNVVDVSKSKTVLPGLRRHRTRTRSNTQDPDAASDENSSNDESSESDAKPSPKRPTSLDTSSSPQKGVPKRKRRTTDTSHQSSKSSRDSSPSDINSASEEETMTPKRPEKPVVVTDAINVTPIPLATIDIQVTSPARSCVESRRESLTAPDLSLEELEACGEEQAKEEVIKKGAMIMESIPEVADMPNLIRAVDSAKLSPSSYTVNTTKPAMTVSDVTMGDDNDIVKAEEAVKSPQVVKKRSTGRPPRVAVMKDEQETRTATPAVVDVKKKGAAPSSEKKNEEKATPGRKRRLGGNTSDSGGVATKVLSAEKKKLTEDKPEPLSGKTPAKRWKSTETDYAEKVGLTKVKRQKGATVSKSASKESKRDDELELKKEDENQEDEVLPTNEVKVQVLAKVPDPQPIAGSCQSQESTADPVDKSAALKRLSDAEEYEAIRRVEAAEMLLMSQCGGMTGKSDGAVNAATMSSFNDSPPDTSDDLSLASSAAPDEGPMSGGESPAEHNSTKSEQEANLEVESYMRSSNRAHLTVAPLCTDSPSGFEFSTASNDDSSGSSSGVQQGAGPGYKQGGECTSSSRMYSAGATDLMLSALKSKQRGLVEHREGRGESTERSCDKGARKRRRHKDGFGSMDKGSAVIGSNVSYKVAAELSDSDDGFNLDNSVSATVQCKALLSPSKSGGRCHAHKMNKFDRSSSRYNFLDREEGKYLEGDERIKFLTQSIQELRTVYMQLKAEVACIDRRRKRHRGGGAGGGGGGGKEKGDVQPTSTNIQPSSSTAIPPAGLT